MSVNVPPRSIQNCHLPACIKSCPQLPLVTPGHRNSPCPGVAMGHETAGEEREARMNLHRLLGKRLAEGRPVRVGLIGAGQVRLHVPVAGAVHAGHRGRGDRRSGAGPRARGVPARRLERGAHRRDALHRRCGGDARAAGHRGGGGGHRPRPRRHRARAARDRRGQAYRHGQRRGRCAGGRRAGARGGARPAWCIRWPMAISRR